MIKINTHTLAAVREPVPVALLGLQPESLADLSWTDPSLGLTGVAWWPAEAVPPAFDADTHRLGDEVLTPDAARQVVQVSHAVVALTADELAARLAARKADLVAAATARRWDVETGGIVLPNGARIDTARSDQDAITRVLVNAGAAGVEQINFKAASGWLTLTIDQLRGIASAIALHVQACYDAERAHHEAIAALPTIASARAYDVAEGWPA